MLEWNTHELIMMIFAYLSSFDLFYGRFTNRKYRMEYWDSGRTSWNFPHFHFPPFGLRCYCAGIFKQSMRARNRVGTGLSYRPARLHRIAELISWSRFSDTWKVKSLKIWAQNIRQAGISAEPFGKKMSKNSAFSLSFRLRSAAKATSTRTDFF